MRQTRIEYSKPTKNLPTSPLQKKEQERHDRGQEKRPVAKNHAREGRRRRRRIYKGSAMATREQKRKRKGEGRGKKKMVWEEVDNDYRVGTIRGGKETRTHTHILESVLGKDGREEKRRKVAERMGRIRREENRMAREAE